MTQSTMTTRNLAIDGMSGDPCIKQVTTALKSVPGISTESVKVGSATIGADDTGCAAACAAISRAGYKAHEDASADSASKQGRTQDDAVSPSGSKQGSNTAGALKPNSEHAGHDQSGKPSTPAVEKNQPQANPNPAKASPMPSPKH